MADKSKYNEEKETTTTYTIKSDDSLSKIASQYKTTVVQIQKARIATHLEIFTKDDVKNFAKDAKKKYEEDKSPNKPKPTQIKVPIEKDIYKIEEQEIVKTPKANDTATLKDNCETQTEQEPSQMEHK